MIFRVIACHIVAVILLLAVGCATVSSDAGYEKDITPGNGETWR